MKKFFSALMVVLLMGLMILPASAKEHDVLSFGQISVTMPEIKVELKGTEYKKDDISATLDTDKLTVVDVADYDIKTSSTCAYILVDLSTSMWGSFSLVKDNITSFIESLGEKDRIVLITFGETEVNTVLTGDEDRDTAIATVNGLRCNEEGTLFYEALSKAYQMSSSSANSFDREYVIAFSDGIDVQKGKTTFDEVVKQYGSHALPLYAACCSNASKDAADKFGEISRVSGGDLSIIMSKANFSDFLSVINDVTIIKLSASTNFADGKNKQLSLKVGSSRVEISIPVVRSIPDNEAPTVKDVQYDAANNTIIISFSEKVNGAENVNAYKVTGEKGKPITITSVFYSESNNHYELKTNDSIGNGTYTIEFSGIKDSSMEANPLSTSTTFKVSKTAETENVDNQLVSNDDEKEFPIWLIIVIAVGIIMIVALVIILLTHSSKKKEYTSEVDSSNDIPVRKSVDTFDYQAQQDQVKHHIVAENAIRIRLKIKTGRMSEQNIETSIVSSLIVGRSDTCDIYIDDTKLSRQHFVIENDDGNFYIMDLQSKNGTMLNGVRINSRQKLQSGDKILAGLSDIIITIIGG